MKKTLISFLASVTICCAAPVQAEDVDREAALASSSESFSAVQAQECGSCHTAIIPFLERPTKSDRIARKRFKDPERRWKLLGGYVFEIGDGDEVMSVEAYGRTAGEVKRLYAVVLPNKPIRYYLPAEGQNPHDVLAR